MLKGFKLALMVIGVSLYISRIDCRIAYLDLGIAALGLRHAAYEA